MNMASCIEDAQVGSTASISLIADTVCCADLDVGRAINEADIGDLDGKNYMATISCLDDHSSAISSQEIYSDEDFETTSDDYEWAFPDDYQGTVQPTMFPGSMLKITFSPGELGLVLSASPANGKVLGIKAGCQAEQNGVQEHMVIQDIDGRPYCEGLLKNKKAGSDDFEVTFRQAPSQVEEVLAASPYELALQSSMRTVFAEQERREYQFQLGKDLEIMSDDTIQAFSDRFYLLGLKEKSRQGELEYMTESADTSHIVMCEEGVLVTAEEDCTSALVASLPKGTKVGVLRVHGVRARIASPEGWITTGTVDGSSHFVVKVEEVHQQWLAQGANTPPLDTISPLELAIENSIFTAVKDDEKRGAVHV